TSLIQPLNGSTEVELNTTLEWNSITEATGYRISIGTTPGGTEIVSNQDLGNTTSFTPSAELPEGSTIYVRITPYNSAGDAVACSEESFTTTTQLKAPVCTSLIQPLNGASDVELTATLQWNSVSEATGYRISIGTTPGGTELVSNQDLGNTASFTPSAELPEGSTIYVRITPYNYAGSALSCSEESFITAQSFDLGQTKYGVSPNGDSINDFWEIPNIENYRDNLVTIYNRWGDIVFKVEGYDNQSLVFNGIANMNTSIGSGELPDGTYFFEILANQNGNSKAVKGFIVLKR
uniref:T9SS type B sorting domain-containing protein n=1 Tax=Galbibacter sp. TaxID=2918471 RepID=UPI003A904246